MQQVRELLSQDRYAEHTGIELVEVSEGHAVARLELKDIHFNGFKVVMGGAIFTLADFAFAAACNSHGAPAVALGVNIAFMKGGKGNVLTAEATEISRTKRTGHYQMIVTDEEGDVVAQMHGIAYRKVS